MFRSCAYFAEWSKASKFSRLVGSTRAFVLGHKGKEEPTDTKNSNDSDIDERMFETDKKLALLSIAKQHQQGQQGRILICDAGYGFPSEKRPRREKILAVSKQIYNFLQWQCGEDKEYAHIKIISKNKSDEHALRSRLEELWAEEGDLPEHVKFVCNGNNQTNVDLYGDGVYLSPDAALVLDPKKQPPSTVIVGMLIDRRIQPNRSLNWSKKLSIKSARWPLEVLPDGTIHPQEPLNVDVVLEGMQQWWWNAIEDNENNSSFVQAATQALQHHEKRHPNRPRHKV